MEGEFKSRALWVRIFTCAWHDVQAALLACNRKKNARRYRTEGQRQQGKGAIKMRCPEEA